MASSDAAGVGIKSEIFIFLDLFKKKRYKRKKQNQQGGLDGALNGDFKKGGPFGPCPPLASLARKVRCACFVSPFEQIMVSAKIFMSVCSGIKVAVPLISTKDVYLMCACGVPPDSWKEDLTEDP